MAGIPFVWGNRVKIAAEGAIAINCLYCGELTIADCLTLKQSPHIYYITGKSREVGK